MDRLIPLVRFTLETDRRLSKEKHDRLNRVLHSWWSVFSGRDAIRRQIRTQDQIIQGLDTALRKLEDGDYRPAAKELRSMSNVALAREEPLLANILMTLAGNLPTSERIAS